MKRQQRYLLRVPTIKTTRQTTRIKIFKKNQTRSISKTQRNYQGRRIQMANPFLNACISVFPMPIVRVLYKSRNLYIRIFIAVWERFVNDKTRNIFQAIVGFFFAFSACAIRGSLVGNFHEMFRKTFEISQFWWWCWSRASKPEFRRNIWSMCFVTMKNQHELFRLGIEYYAIIIYAKINLRRIWALKTIIHIICNLTLIHDINHCKTFERFKRFFSIERENFEQYNCHRCHMFFINIFFSMLPTTKWGDHKFA